MKYLKITLFTLFFSALLCLTAMAATEENTGISNVSIVEPTKTTVTMYTDTGTTPLTKDSAGIYPKSERYDITYHGATPGEDYVIFVLDGDATTPTDGNILYINQTEADGSGILTFENVYPTYVTKDGITGGTVYIAGGTQGLTEIASYDYHTAEFTVSAGSNTTIPGGNVAVDVNVNNNPGISSLSFNVSFDKNKLTYKGFTTGSIWTVNDNNVSASNDTGVVAVNISTAANVSSFGKVLTLNFDAANVTSNVDTALTVTSIETLRLGTDNVPVAVVSKTENGVVTIALYTLGDINDDGIINILDALHILNYIAKNETFTDTQKLAANVDNSSTAVNINDALKVLNYIAKNISSF
jgi:hypothetical protein